MPQQFVVQGRIVFGHPAKARPKKDVRTKQPIIKDGQPVQQYVFGLAIDKATFGNQVWPMLYKEAIGAFPNGIPQNFSYKFKDGDGVDSKGNPFNTREGYAGHCVLTISTEGFAPALYKQENGQWVQMPGEQVKCGDYVAVALNIKYNGAVSPNTPGLYINPNGVLFIGYGSEIVSSGQDPDELFAGYQVVLPPGASATPVMGSAPLPSNMAPGAGMPVQPGYGAPVNPTTMPPQGQQYMTSSPAHPAPLQPGYPQQPSQLPAPAHDFVNNAMGHAPAQPQPYGQAPTQPGYPQQPSQYGAPANPTPPVAGYPPANAPSMPQAGYAPQPTNPAMAYPSNPTAPAAPGGYPGVMPGR